MPPADHGPGSAARAGRPVSTNRGRVLDLVRTRAPISRVELAEASGLTQAAITRLVRTLLADGLLRETGQREYTGGKPRVMLTLVPLARCSVGVQLGADWVVVVLVDARGQVVARTRVRGARTTVPQEVVAAVAEQVALLLHAAAVDPAAVVGLGLAVAGVVDRDAGTLVSTDLGPAWRGVAVQHDLADATGLPVLMDSDATAAAIGEFWNGRVEASRAHCTLYLGSRLAAGLLVSGSVYRGASSNAGLVGRMRPGGPGTASVDEAAGPQAVAEQVRAQVAAGRSSTVELSADGDPFSDFAAVAAAALDGDAVALEAVAASADLLADAVLSTVDLWDPDTVVLAGPSFATAGSLYLPVVRDRLRDRAAARRHEVEVRLAPNPSDAAAVGAAAAVLQEELSPRRLGGREH